jgi:hypothetical protein
MSSPSDYHSSQKDRHYYRDGDEVERGIGSPVFPAHCFWLPGWNDGLLISRA